MDTGPEQLTDYSEDGIDLTLIRWMLSLTPAERLTFHEEHVDEILAIWERSGIEPLVLTVGSE
jgi:hypothetical protein